jgi:hypothetical protein
MAVHFGSYDQRGLIHLLPAVVLDWVVTLRLEAWN